MSPADRWDARYRVTGRGEPGPPSALVDRLECLPVGGRALDVACGRGTVAVWLASRGFAVDAVDASTAGLALGRELAAAHDVTVRWIEADLDAGLPCAGPYDVVVVQRFRDPALYRAILAALGAGGLLVVTVLSEVGDTGGSFRAAPGELLEAFGGLEVLAHTEGNGEASLVARRR